MAQLLCVEASPSGELSNIGAIIAAAAPAIAPQSRGGGDSLQECCLSERKFPCLKPTKTYLHGLNLATGTFLGQFPISEKCHALVGTDLKKLDWSLFQRYRTRLAGLRQ